MFDNTAMNNEKKDLFDKTLVSGLVLVTEPLDLKDLKEIKFSILILELI